MPKVVGYPRFQDRAILLSRMAPMATRMPSFNRIAPIATPAKHVGIVEAADADAAIEEAIKEFEIKDPSRQKRLIAVASGVKLNAGPLRGSANLR